MKNRSKHTPWIFVSIAAMLLFSVSCKTENDGKKETEVIPVKIHTVKNRRIVYPIRCSGILSSQAESKLSFKIGGVIDKVHVREGDVVKKGRTLALLNLAEIEANVTMTKSALDKATRDYTRAKNLYNDSVVTLEQFQNAKTALDVARSNYEIAQFNRRYSIIQAPASGKILKKLAEENEVIGAGHPVFLFASTESSWIVKTSITDKDIVHLQMGDSAHLDFDAFPGKHFKGIVSEMGSMADPYTGTYEVELTLTQNPEKMASGLIAKIDIYPSYIKTLPFIPHNAIIESNEMTGYVYVLKDTVPIKTQIQIEKIEQNGLAVKEGVREGDIVITDGLHYINNGSKIKIVK